MTIEHYLLITLVQTILSALVAVLALFQFRSRDVVVRLIGIIFLVGFLANIAGWLLVKTVTYRGLINYSGSIYVIVAFCLYSWIYFNVLHRKKLVIFVIVVMVFMIFALANLFFGQQAQNNSYTTILSSSILIVYALLYFHTLTKDLPSLHLHRIPMFWFNSGLLIFHSGTFFLIAFLSYLVNVLKDNLLFYWSFHNLLNIIEHFIFLVGLYYDLKLLKGKKGSVAQTSFR